MGCAGIITQIIENRSKENEEVEKKGDPTSYALAPTYFFERQKIRIYVVLA